MKSKLKAMVDVEMEVWKSSLSAHKLSNIFMIVGFLVAFLSLFLGISLYDYNRMKTDEIREYEYPSQSAYYVYGLGQIEDSMEGWCQQCDINIDIFEYMVYLNDAKVTRACEIRLKQSEEYIYPLMEGKWNEKTESSESIPTVVIGRAYEPYIVKKNGESYLTINYCDYKITGILSGETGTLDYAIILNYETMPENERKKLFQTTYCGIRFGSVNATVSDAVRIFQEACMGQELYMEAAETGNSVAYNTVETENVKFYVLIYIFALGMCVICSELWIYERKTEIIICKIFGWKKDQIIEHYFKEFLRVLSISVIFSLISQFIILVIGKQYVQWSVYYLCITICMVMLSAIIAFVIPMLKIQVYMPEELLTKESEFG